jgi:hypothetical protein
MGSLPGRNSVTSDRIPVPIDSKVDAERREAAHRPESWLKIGRVMIQQGIGNRE